MNIKKETTTKTNSKIFIFMSTYYFNFLNFLFTFKAMVFFILSKVSSGLLIKESGMMSAHVMDLR